MLNWVFIVLVVGGVLTAAFTGSMPKVTEASLASAKTAVDLAISLAGQMTLWLGFMGVLKEAGLLHSLGRALTPVMRRLFPEIPEGHPAMGAMIMNLAANMLGLGNAATPFGLKAMSELDKLNPHRGIATNAMALFLAINTSGVAVLALGVVAVRTTLGSKDPAGILIPSLLATMGSTLAAIAICKWTERASLFAPSRYGAVALEPAGPAKAPDPSALAQAEATAAARPKAPRWRVVLAWAIGLAMLVAFGRQIFLAPPELQGFPLARNLLSDWMLPLLMLVIVSLGLGRGVKVYEAFIASAKEGFHTAVMIIPYLVAIIVAIGIFRASGAMEALVALLGTFTGKLGFPAEALPMALIRPLSGSGALAVMTETMKTYGPDSFVGYLVSVINGSTETTFYVLALYFGSVQVRVLRHTLIACVAADLVGIIGSAVVCHLWFG